MAQLAETCRTVHQISDKRKQFLLFLVDCFSIFHDFWIDSVPFLHTLQWLSSWWKIRLIDFFFTFVFAVCHVTWAFGFSPPRSFFLYLRYFCCLGLMFLLAVLLKVQMLWDVARYSTFVSAASFPKHCVTSHKSCNYLF